MQRQKVCGHEFVPVTLHAKRSLLLNSITPSNTCVYLLGFQVSLGGTVRKTKTSCSGETGWIKAWVIVNICTPVITHTHPNLITYLNAAYCWIKPLWICLDAKTCRKGRLTILESDLVLGMKSLFPCLVLLEAFSKIESKIKKNCKDQGSCLMGTAVKPKAANCKQDIKLWPWQEQLTSVN